MKLRKIYFLLIVTLLLGGCSIVSNSNSQKPIDDGKPLVYTSIYPMYDFTDKIGKENIDIRLMVPSGVEPHDWEPSAKMMAEMEQADAIIYNGVNMEPWIDKILAALDGDIAIIEASKDIELISLKEHIHEGEDEHSHGSYDPHIWLDPMKAKKQAETIKSALITLDPESKEYYESNYKEFSLELDKLDKKYKEELKNIKNSEIIVSHSAFGYLTHRYGLEQISIMGLSPQEEPSAAKMAELTKEVKRHNINTIFFETLTNPKLSQVLAKEVGAKTAVLHPIGGLTLEELEEGKDYIKLMEENLIALVKALGE